MDKWKMIAFGHAMASLNVRSILYLFMLTMLLLTACSSPEEDTVDQGGQTVAEATDILEENSAPTEQAQPTEAPTALPIPTDTPIPVPTSTPTEVPPSVELGVTYLVDRVSAEPSRADEFTLNIRTITFNPDSTEVEISFDNRTNQRYNLIGDELLLDYFRIVTASGERLMATSLSPTLNNFTPEDGIPVGASNIGRISFPAIQNPTSLTFEFATEYRYEPITVSADELTTTTAASSAQLPLGAYDVGLQVFSHQDSVAPLRLDINTVTLTENEVTFDVSFTNIGIYQGYNIIPSPTGFDASLVDGARQAFRPNAVSDSLQQSITGDNGLNPNESWHGTITFPLENSLDGSLFVFNFFEPVRLMVADSGSLQASLATVNGVAPLPQPTPPADVAAFQQLPTVFNDLCNAIIGGDSAEWLTYVAPDPAYQETNTTFFEQLTRLPVAECEMSTQADSSALSGAERGQLRNIRTFLKITHAGVTDNNPFGMELAISFQQNNGGWDVTDIGYFSSNQAPFWVNSDAILEETEHFYVFASPSLADRMPELKAEVEQAYQILLDNNAPAEGKYHAYFVATTSEYRRLSGANSAGLAPRQSFSQDDFAQINRFFYVDVEKTEGIVGGRIGTTTHELVHVVMTEHETDAVPEWFTEGIAEYLSNGYQLATTTTELRDLQSISLVSFTQLRDIGTNFDRYAYAGLFISYLAETYGEAAVLDFFYSFEQVPYENSGFDQTETLTRQFTSEFFATDLETLDQNFKQWLETRY